MAIVQLLIEQHKKLYTVRDGKKMRLEFKSQRKPPVVDLRGVTVASGGSATAADEDDPPPPPPTDAPPDKLPSPRAPAPVSRRQPGTPTRGPLRGPARSPRGPPLRSPSRGASGGHPLHGVSSGPVSPGRGSAPPSPMRGGGGPIRATDSDNGWPESEKRTMLAQPPAANAAAALQSLALLRSSAEQDAVRLADVRTTANFLRKHLSALVER